MTRKSRNVFLIIHLVAIFAATAALLTGLRIASLSHTYLHWLSPVLPQGNMHKWHLLATTCFMVCVVAYFIFRLYQTKVTHSKAMRHPLAGFKKYHLWVNRFGYITVLGLTCSGPLLWLQMWPVTMAQIHYYAALSLLLYLLLHSYVYVLQYGRLLIQRLLTPLVRPHSQRVTAMALLLLAITSTGLYQLVTANNSQELKLLALANTTPVHIDGQANEDFWQHAPSITIHTSGGANFIDGSTNVTIKAAANANESYFLFRWFDPTQSLQHLPLVKTPQGWQVQQNGFHHFDETEFYEDKFAVLLSKQCGHGGDNTTHLGHQPFADKPANWHGKGYHASLDGKVRDLWHWKAVRTDHKRQADDNHFGPLLQVRSGERRYTAGYHTDGKESGGYVMNWQWYSPSTVTPKRLPNPDYLTQPHHAAFLPWFDSQPYQPEQDHFPLGTQLPSVLYRSNQFEGDRGHVAAKGQWQQGYWTLEIARKHNTGSAHDVELANGTCLWVSAFDSSQTAHTRHQRAVQLHYPEQRDAAAAVEFAMATPPFKE